LAHFLRMSNKKVTMKKIFILFTILAFAYSTSAQFSRNGVDNNAVKTSFSSPVVLTDGSMIENITVYPNPVTDLLKVSFKSNQSSIAVISIFNNIGKQAFSQESEVESGTNILSIDIRSHGIEPGIYFVQLKIGREVATRKLIVK
jgi:hypothetical protein